MLAIVYFVQIIDYRSRTTLTGNEYAAQTDWSKEQDKGKVSKGRNTKCQNRSIQISSLNDTREKILPSRPSFAFTCIHVSECKCCLIKLNARAN